MFDVWELWLVLEGPGMRKNVQASYCRDVAVYEVEYDGPLNSDYGPPYHHIRTDKMWCGPFTYNTQQDCITRGRGVVLDGGFLVNRWGQRPEGGRNFDVEYYDVWKLQCRKGTSETRGRSTREIINWKPDWEIDWDAREERDERGRDMQHWKDAAEYDRTKPERVYQILPDLTLDDEPSGPVPLVSPKQSLEPGPMSLCLEGYTWRPCR